MVPLEYKISYLEGINENQNLLSFYDFLNNKQLKNINSENLIEIDRFYFDLMNLLQKDQRQGFIKSYDEFSRRKPSLDNPWINNDRLIFIIICGIIKYNLETKWIESVISIRQKTDNYIYNKINKTFSNLVKNNYTSNDNFFEIVIVFLDLLNKLQLPNDILNQTYLSIPNNFIQNRQNDFICLVTLRANDLIIINKELPDTNEIANLKAFKITFVNRINILSYILYFLLLITFIVVNIYLFKHSKDFKNFITDLSIVFTLLGAGILFAFKLIRRIIKFVILFIFGYIKFFKE